GEEIGRRRAVDLFPQRIERLALELAAEQAAHPRARQAEARAIRLGAQDEAVAERAADGAGLDLGPLGRGARAAPLVPIGVERLRRGMFQGTPLLVSVALGLDRPCPGSGHRMADRARAGTKEQGACRAGGWALPDTRKVWLTLMKG